MTTERTDTDTNDVTIAYRRHSEFAESINNHEIVTDHVWGTAIDGEFENGWLDSETCTIRIHVSVAMDGPAWKLVAFEDAIPDRGCIVERRVEGSFSAPIRYTKSGIPTPGSVTPPAEKRTTHTGYYTIEFDITDQLIGRTH
ncbi:MAG: hypothetical protein ABEI77_02650 [Halorientalis sp.]